MMKEILPLSLRFSLGSLLLLSAANLASAQETVPSPTLFYDFNSSDGYTLVSSGTAEMNLDMYTWTDRTQGAAAFSNRLGGVGPSGAPGDRTLNLSNATQMGGSNSYGGGAVGGSLDTISGLDGAKSLTIAGWFNATQSPITTNAHLINTAAGSAAAGYTGFRLDGRAGGALELTIAGENGRVAFTSDSSYGAVGSWIFFAVTFDNIGPGDSVVNFYIGGVDGEVALASSTLTGNVGDFKAGTRPLTIGNVAVNDGSFGTNRPFQGYMDNIGLWSSTEDSSGALTIQQLENLRQQQVIPEPSVAACLLGAFALLACLKTVFKKRTK